MQKTSLTLGLILTLALAVVIDAQQRGGGRGGFDAAAIATALPLEGAPPALPGPYKVEGGPAFNSPGHVVYRPVDLTPFPARDTLPLIVWGNGGCAINSTRYAGFLTTIASHGFVVMATAAQEGVTRATAVEAGLVTRAGFEPATPSFGGWCSIQLSYWALRERMVGRSGLEPLASAV